MSIFTYKKLFPYIKKYKNWFLLNGIGATIANICLLTAPLYIGYAMNQIVSRNQTDFAAMKRDLIIVVIMIVFGTFFTWVSSTSAYTFSARVIKSVRNDAFKNLNHVPVSYVDTTASGDIMNKFSNDSDVVYDALSNFFNQFLGGILTLLLSIAFMLYLNPKLTLIVIALATLNVLFSRKIASTSQGYFTNMQKKSGELNSLSEEYIGEQKLIIAYNYQDDVIHNFKDVSYSLMKVSKHANFLAAVAHPLTRFVNNATYCMIGFAASYIFSGSLLLGTLTSFLTYAAMFSKPFNEFSGVTAQIMAGASSLKRIFDLIEADAETEEYPYINYKIMEGKIDFNHVSFAYNKENSLIEDLDLQIKNGSKIAIVGPTGAGKSTMINLLMRYYDIDKGNIMVDGHDIAKMDRADLRQNIGLVLQETWLFEGSIRDNIAYGKPDATIEEIISAAKTVGCHDFIMTLENQYDTLVKEGAKNLSLGQRQLITVARAIITDPVILILDEATSNIDRLTERKIQETFQKIMKNRTSFFVAHRLSNVIDADCILVMDKGKIVEYGKHNELMKINGFYKELYTSQFIA